jgi:hypothetical protein
VAQATTGGHLRLGGATLKRTPRGFDASHPRAALLLHTGLVAIGRWPIPAELSTPGFVAWVAERLERASPIERWLADTLYPSA